MRRVRTASGAAAVQIAEYIDGRRRIVAHLGSALTGADLGLLLEQARGMLVHGGQDELDLGDLAPALLRGVIHRVESWVVGRARNG